MLLKYAVPMNVFHLLNYDVCDAGSILLYDKAVKNVEKDLSFSDTVYEVGVKDKISKSDSVDDLAQKLSEFKEDYTRLDKSQKRMLESFKKMTG